jgi:acetate kinase
VGAYAAALGGVNAIGFAGGIGEHSPEMRRRICSNLEFLGIRIDPELNTRAAGEAPARISADGAAVQIWVVPTDEEAQIARELYGLLR